MSVIALTGWGASPTATRRGTCRFDVSREALPNPRSPSVRSSIEEPPRRPLSARLASRRGRGREADRAATSLAGFDGMSSGRRTRNLVQLVRPLAAANGAAPSRVGAISAAKPTGRYQASNGRSIEVDGGVSSSAPLLVITMSSSRRMPNSPGM